MRGQLKLPCLGSAVPSHGHTGSNDTLFLVLLVPAGGAVPAFAGLSVP